jgi:hypothetical protein
MENYKLNGKNAIFKGSGTVVGIILRMKGKTAPRGDFKAIITI